VGLPDSPHYDPDTNPDPDPDYYEPIEHTANANGLFINGPIGSIVRVTSPDASTRWFRSAYYTPPGTGPSSSKTVMFAKPTVDVYIGASLNSFNYTNLPIVPGPFTPRTVSIQFNKSAGLDNAFVYVSAQLPTYPLADSINFQNDAFLFTGSGSFPYFSGNTGSALAYLMVQTPLGSTSGYEINYSMTPYDRFNATSITINAWEAKYQDVCPSLSPEPFDGAVTFSLDNYLPHFSYSAKLADGSSKTYTIDFTGIRDVYKAFNGSSGITNFNNLGSSTDNGGVKYFLERIAHMHDTALSKLKTRLSNFKFKSNVDGQFEDFCHNNNKFYRLEKVFVNESHANAGISFGSQNPITGEVDGLFPRIFVKDELFESDERNACNEPVYKIRTVTNYGNAQVSVGFEFDMYLSDYEKSPDRKKKYNAEAIGTINGTLALGIITTTQKLTPGYQPLSCVPAGPNHYQAHGLPKSTEASVEANGEIRVGVSHNFERCVAQSVGLGIDVSKMDVAIADYWGFDTSSDGWENCITVGDYQGTNLGDGNCNNLGDLIVPIGEIEF